MPDDAPQITLDIPPGDIAGVGGLVNRFVDELHMTIPEALTWTAWYVARSLGASTRKAPKTRPLKRNPGTAKWPADRYPQYVEIWGVPGRDDHYRKYFIPAGEEQTHPSRKISRSGLAAKSWMWAVGDLGRSTRGATAGLHRPAGAIEGRHAGGLLDPAVVMTNRLRYIHEALRLGGRRPVDEAFARAARAAEQYLERRAKKRAAASA